MLKCTSSGYTGVYGFNIPAANQVKGFKWNDGDEGTTNSPAGGHHRFYLGHWAICIGICGRADRTGPSHPMPPPPPLSDEPNFESNSANRARSHQRLGLLVGLLIPIGGRIVNWSWLRSCAGTRFWSSPASYRVATTPPRLVRLGQRLRQQAICTQRRKRARRIRERIGFASSTSRGHPAPQLWQY